MMDAAKMPWTHGELFREAENVPDFWVTSPEDIRRYLAATVQRGFVSPIGQTAGGRSIPAVFYGNPRSGRGTTTFSGAIGFRAVQAYLGPDHGKRVYMAMGAVHGGEFEGIAGLINLVHVLETGTDLKGKAWPELAEVAAALDRVILIPVTNVDGRSRIPLRMTPHRGRDKTMTEGLNTGVWADGTKIGWPTCKEFIPLDFTRTLFPGGYPNDGGVNIQHDDFFAPGRQPETEALLRLTANERPDLILNMHTGAPGSNYFTRMHRPFGEPVLQAVFDELYRAVHTDLTNAGLQSSEDAQLEGDPAKAPCGCFNLDTALNLHCGALAVLIEAPSHGFSGTDRDGNVVVQTPEQIVDAQLVCHRAAIRFLLDTGGRSRWTPART